MLFNFNTNLESLNERSVFINYILKLVCIKYDYDFDAIVKNEKYLFNSFNHFIKNSYELIGNEVPLWAYYELTHESKEQAIRNYSCTEEEYNQALSVTKEMLYLYY